MVLYTLLLGLHAFTIVYLIIGEGLPWHFDVNLRATAYPRGIPDHDADRPGADHCHWGFAEWM